MSDDVRVKFSALTPVTSQAQVLPAINALIANLTPLVGQHKNKNERAVQWSDLLSLGLANVKGLTDDGYPDYGLPPAENPDMTTPPAIVNFTALASFNFVTMSWDQPRYKNHAFVEIWRAPGFKKLPDGREVPTVRSDAVFRLMTASIVCSDTVLPGDKWRYWARNVSSNGVFGPWTSIDGLLAEVPEDPGYLIDKISGEIREGDLYPALGAKIDASYNGVNEHTQALVEVRDELQAHADSLVQHGQVLAQHTNTISAQGASITQQGLIIASQGDLLTQHTTALSQHGNSITEQSRILTTHEATLVSHGQSLATQNAAISDLKTITETQGGVLAQHTTQLTTANASITDLKSLTEAQGITIAQHTSQITTANANITSVTQIVTNQGQTLAEHTQTLAAHGTAIQQQATINTEQGALINAAWTVRIDSGNAVSGFGLMVDGATGRSDFIIRSDRFAIAAPQAYDQNGKPIVNTAAFPFIVDVTNPASPKVLIKNAYIDQAFIQTLVTGSLVADRITGQTLTGTHIRGGDMAIGSNFSVDSAGSATMLNAFIKGTVQSVNYGAGTSGWQIHNNGNAEFNNAVLRGTVYATGGWFQGTVYAEKMVGGVFSQKLYTSASSAMANNTGWRTAFTMSVTRGMSLARAVELVTDIGIANCQVQVIATTPEQNAYGTAIFEVRILRDGAQVYISQFSLTASPPYTGPNGGSSTAYSYGLLPARGVVSIPGDGATHTLSVQYRVASTSASSGSVDVNPAIGVTSTLTTFGRLYIDNGDLA